MGLQVHEWGCPFGDHGHKGEAAVPMTLLGWVTFGPLSSRLGMVAVRARRDHEQAVTTAKYEQVQPGCWAEEVGPA